MLFTSFLSSFQWKYQQHQDAGNMKTEIAGAKKKSEKTQVKTLVQQNS